MSPAQVAFVLEANSERKTRRGSAKDLMALARATGGRAQLPAANGQEAR